MMTILGIDPGSQIAGFGAVRTDGRSIKFLSYGVIVPPAHLAFNERISVVGAELEAIFEKLAPEVVVIERVFLGKSADSAFKLGHVRGVAVAAAIRAGCEVVEYAARAVKKGITGNGGAEKDQVQAVLAALLNLKGKVKTDASDALALAFYHARNIDVDRRLRESEA